MKDPDTEVNIKDAPPATTKAPGLSSDRQTRSCKSNNRRPQKKNGRASRAPNGMDISSQSFQDDWLRRPLEREDSDYYLHCSRGKEDQSSFHVSDSHLLSALPDHIVVFEEHELNLGASYLRARGDSDESFNESKTCSVTQSTYTTQDIRLDSDPDLDVSAGRHLPTGSESPVSARSPYCTSEGSESPYASIPSESPYATEYLNHQYSDHLPVQNAANDYHIHHTRCPEPLMDNCGRHSVEPSIEDFRRRRLEAVEEDCHRTPREALCEVECYRRPDPQYAGDRFANDIYQRDERRRWNDGPPEIPRQSVRSFYSSTREGSFAPDGVPRPDCDDVSFPSNHSRRRDSTEYYDRGNCQSGYPQRRPDGRRGSRSYDRTRPGAFKLRESPRNENRPRRFTSRDAGDVMVEISPGFQVPLRRSQETTKAISVDFYSPITCVVCSLDHFCIADAAYVICPDCKTVSAVHGYDYFEGLPIKRVGLGLGFTCETLLNTQAEILKDRSSHHQRKPIPY